MKKRLLLGLVFVLALAGPVAADDGGRPISVEMTGAAEAPGPGDPDGSGLATFTLNQGQNEICYELSVSNLDPVIASHIHVAPVGSPGPVVVPLVAPVTGSSSACAVVDPELIKAIRQNPENYYVNVHTTVYPGGAVRAQLGK